MCIYFINSSLFQGPESEGCSCLPLSACMYLVCKTCNSPKIYMYVNTFPYLSQIETRLWKEDKTIHLWTKMVPAFISDIFQLQLELLFLLRIMNKKRVNVKSTLKSTEETYWNVWRHFNVRLAIKKKHICLMEQVWCQDDLILTGQVWSIKDLLCKCWTNVGNFVFCSGSRSKQRIHIICLRIQPCNMK